MAEKVFYEVVSGNQKLPVHDVSAHARLTVDEGKITELSGSFTAHVNDTIKHITSQERTKWDNATTAIQSHSGNADLHLSAGERTKWDKAVSDLADHTGNSDIHVTAQQKADWTQTSADFAAHAADDGIHVTTADKELWNTVEDKIDKTDFETYQQTVSDEFANTSAWANQQFQPVGNYVSAGDFETYKDYVDDELDKLEDKVDEKLDTTATSSWDVSEYTGDAGIEVLNHVISFTADYVSPADLSTALENYYTKVASDSLYQPKGDYALASDLEDYALKTDLNGLASETYVDSAFEDTIEYVEEHFYNTTVVAGKGITVSSDIDENGDVEYTVSTQDPDDILNWARFNSLTATYTTGTTATLAFTSAEGAGTNITLNGNNQVVLDKGSYHVDIQVIADISGGDAAYYDAGLSAGSTRAVVQSIDGSYAHTETLDLSFDVRIQNDGSILNFELAGLPPCTYAVQNMNIHEFLTLEAAQEAAAGAYNAGQGLSLDPATNTFDVNVGDGLEIKTGNVLQVKLGEGLAFTDEHGIKAISIDPEGEVEKVVESVQKMEADLDTKVTVNYQPSQITTYTDFATAGEVNNGELLGFLFSVPINNKIYLAEDNEKYITHIGIYSHQSYNQNYVMLGLYEFQPDFPQYINDDPTQGISAYGKTVPLCDTGRVTLSGGFNEFPIKHTNSGYAGNNYTPETTKELKSNCMYYAAIFIPKQAGTGVELASCPNYNVNFNTTPQISTNQTNITTTLSSDAVSFNDIGFGGWAGGQNYHEWPSAPRLWMQIRNKERPKN